MTRILHHSRKRPIWRIALLLPLYFFCLPASGANGRNADDPYEAINRKIYAFNMQLDAIFLKPSAKIYVKIIPDKVRAAVNNVFNNINMLPTIANDMLQANGQVAIRDAKRFLMNSTIGIAGIMDPASDFNLPPHSNDLGLTFAQWGDKQSPFVMIPFLGPSTIRDGMGLLFDFTFFTPYPYLSSDAVIYGLMGLRYVDLRSRMFDTEKLMADAIDPYAFIRDAYLQHRHFLIYGEQPDTGELYVDDDAGASHQPKSEPLLKQTPANGTPSKFPLTTA